MSSKLIKSPMNYTGGKYRLLPQILPLFPPEIDMFVDAFCGGGNVGINARANRYWFNDNLIYLIDLYRVFKKTELAEILEYVESTIERLGLSQTNEAAYLALRALYNQNKKPLDLFLLIAFSFNHQIRFNNAHQFNVPFGRERSSLNERMKSNLIEFVKTLQSRDVRISHLSFEMLDYQDLAPQDFVYFDPPYLISTGTYNDGKRGFKGWGATEEVQLLSLIEQLHHRGIRFALSNVLEHKGKINQILADWLTAHAFTVHDLNMHYGNSSYQSKNRDKSASREVLITNYHGGEK